MASPAFDLVVTDLDMRPMSGLQLLRELRKKHITCPVIFTSGHHGLAEIIADSYGQNASIEKPFTAAELCIAVRGELGRAKRNARQRLEEQQPD